MALDDDLEVMEEKREWSKYKKVYQSKWEEVPEFKDWIQRDPDSPQHCKCIYCNRNIRAHRHDLIKHLNTKLHQRNELSFSFVLKDIKKFVHSDQTAENDKVSKTKTEALESPAETQVGPSTDKKDTNSNHKFVVVIQDDPGFESAVESERPLKRRRKRNPAAVVAAKPKPPSPPLVEDIEIQSIEEVYIEPADPQKDLENLKKQRLEAQIINEELLSYKLKLEVMKLERELGLSKSLYTKSLINPSSME